MTTEDVLNLDCKEYKNVLRLDKCVRKIPAIKKRVSKLEVELVPLEMIEKCIHVISTKYGYIIMNIQPFYGVEHDKLVFWTASVKALEGHVWLGNTYGLTMHEVLSKMLIKLYADVRRKESEQE